MESKCLIAISSCWDFEKNGFNDAQRRTWLPNVATFPNLKYRFFVGTGQGAETQEVTGDHLPFGGMVVNENADTIFLPDVPDDYGHLTYKTQASLRWANARGFDYVLRIFPDCYVCVDRLMKCGFEAFSYYGDFRGEVAAQGNYASGGAGYVLSKEAFTPLLDAPILGVWNKGGVWKDDITVWAEDLWVGRILMHHPELTFHDDWARFVNHGSNYWPKRTNEVITSHLSCPDPYTSPERMYACHQAFLRS